MKIALIIPVLDMGGAETMCENLSYALKDLEHEVTVVSLYTKQTAITERLETNGVNVVYLDKKQGLDISLFFRLARYLKNEKIEVVHTHLYAIKYGMISAVLSGVKRRVHTVHNLANKEMGKLDRKLNYFLYHHCNVTPVALSEINHESIIEEYKIDAKDIPIIYNGIDLSKCQPKGNYDVDGVFTIIHVGRFNEQKNHKGLISAFKIFHDKYSKSRLLLAGDGPLIDEIKKLVSEMELTETVEFLGVQPNIYPYLSKSDVFTLPSNYEGVPMSIIEAMGTGLPIVATAVGGVPNMLTDGHDALLCENDVEEISKCFERVYLEKELRIKLGINSLAESGNFSSNYMAEKYCAVYQS